MKAFYRPAVILAAAITATCAGNTTTGTNGAPCPSDASANAATWLSTLIESPGSGLCQSASDGGTTCVCSGDAQAMCWGLNGDVAAWRTAFVIYSNGVGANLCASQAQADAFVSAYCTLRADAARVRPSYSFADVPGQPCAGLADAGVPTD